MILQVTASPGYGGLEMVIIEFHEWLVKNGHAGKVICFKESPVCKELLQRGQADRLQILEKRSRLAFRNAILENDSRENAFLFHRTQGLKSLFWTHLQASVSMISHTFYGVNKRDLFHQYIYSKVDQWYALTRSHKENVKICLGVADNKIGVLPNGIQISNFQYSPGNKLASKNIKVLLLGRVDPKKGQDIAIEAVKILQKQFGIETELNIVGHDTPGETSIRPQLFTQVSDLGLQNKIQFSNGVQDAGEALEKADILWMPSHQETFGRIILEAMASGVPVIASNAGGVPDIIQNNVNGILFETKNPYDLALKTKELINDKDLYMQIQRRAIAEVRNKYDQDKIFQILYEGLKFKKSLIRAS